MANSGLSEEVTYLILEYVGIGLLLYLFGHCAYRSINYVLQIFCIVAILNNINETVLLLHYDDHVLTRARGTTWCTVSAVFEQYLPLVLSILATSMGFNVWILIVRKSKLTEQQLLVWYCIIAFGLPLIAVGIAIILLRNEPYWTAYPRHYYCDLEQSNITFGTFAIPIMMVAITGNLLTMHTVIYLVRHYFKMRRNSSNQTPFSSSMVLELSHCIRLIVFSMAFGIIVLLAILQRIVETANRDPGYNRSASLDVSSDFSGCLVAFFLFAVFGTTRESLRTMSLLLCPCRKRSRRRRQDDAESVVTMSASSAYELTSEDMAIRNHHSSSESASPRSYKTGLMPSLSQDSQQYEMNVQQYGQQRLWVGSPNSTSPSNHPGHSSHGATAIHSPVESQRGSAK